MFKRLLGFTAVVALMFVLAACNNETDANLTDAEDVLKQSLEAMEGLNSYSMELESEQTMTINDSETISMLMNITADMTLEPMAFYQKLSIESDMEMMGSYETEMYLVNDRIYVFEPMMNDWMELPLEFTEELGGLAEMQLSPDQQLMLLRNFVEDIEMTETDLEYVLKLSGEGTDFVEIAKLFGGIGTDGFDEMVDIFSQLDLNFVEYEIFIDKETLYQTKLNMTMDITMGMDGETVHTVQSMKATVSGYDEVGEITLPEGVKQ